MRRTQYDIDSDQRVLAIEFCLIRLKGLKVKASDGDRYSYDDLVAAILNPELVGTTEAREEWVDRIRNALREAMDAEGVTAGEVLVGLGTILRRAGGRIVSDERSAHQEGS